MSESNEMNMINYDGGSVIFSPDVVSTIAGIAALKVEGIAGMTGGITDGIVQLLGFKNFKKGVKTEIAEPDVDITINVAVKYDTKIQDTCVAVQREVKEAVETMTGLCVKSVNVVVQGVNFEEEKKAK
ncbi:MAG: Asp23/Gls24 family envelope stress response protein [Clostridia bacterium]|nr:Asp23/Gls24 family envelope stress response protein [Clostridia bacterium]